MKIIAVVDPSYGASSYIVQASSQELAEILYGQGYRSGQIFSFHVGAEIRIHEHWTRVRDIESAQARLDSAAQNLRAIAGVLDTISVVVPPATPSDIDGGPK